MRGCRAHIWENIEKKDIGVCLYVKIGELKNLTYMGYGFKNPITKDLLNLILMNQER